MTQGPEIFLVSDGYEQGGDAWFKVRAGTPSSSEFSAILAKGEGRTRRAYMLRLAGERLMGLPEETFKSPAMDRGNQAEPELRSLYMLLTDNIVDRSVGLMRQRGAICSPDGLIGTNGIVQFKSAKPSVLVDLLAKDAFPPGHVAQCQGELWVSDREWTEIAIGWPYPPEKGFPGVPMLIKRAYRDAKFIAELAREVQAFQDELAALVERIRKWG
jgi:hypothetical protein